MFRDHVRVLGYALKLGLAAAMVGALGWSVGPALSLTTYRPQAVDFEQRLHGVKRVAEASGRAPASTRPARASSRDPHVDEGPVRFRSRVIDAPARFDLVGVAGEMRPLEYRARRRDEEWSKWVETMNGDPVYFEGAEQVQVRSRGVRPAGRLHYVNVSGTDTPANRILTGVRRAVNSALISVGSAATADAIPSEPEMVGRDEWGATRRSGGCRPRGGPAYGKVKAAVVHHTVTANDYDPEDAPGIVLGICRFHRNGNGWNDIGYNFLVDRFGTVYVGRSGGARKAVVGAHAQGFNAQTTGVASIGTHTSTQISDAAEDSFVDVISWKLALHGTKAKGKTRLLSAGGPVNKHPRGKRVRVRRVLGHRRVNSTACPGAKLKQRLKRIQRRAQKRIDRNGEIEDEVPEDGGGTGTQER